MALKIFIIFVWFVEHSIQQFDTMGFYRKFPEGEKNNFLYFASGAILNIEVIFCSLKSNCNHKVLIMEATSKLLNQQIDSQKCIVISHRKSTAYKNKSFSSYDIEH